MKPYNRLIRHQGNTALFRTIEASVLSTLAGVPLHLHVEGLRGTGKTTILRSARSLFPRIRRIKGCLCNCDPLRPHCPAHVGLSPSAIAELGVEEVPLPFLEISHSAKTGTVVGTIDLARISEPSNPVAALLPGTIAQAHRGIIFVDEINRLADTSPELADILLDVMGTKPGRIQIEESGLPTVEMPVSVSVWAASNPDEDPGPLETIRRQLSDRFDFVVAVSRPSEVDTVRRILAQAESVAQNGGADTALGAVPGTAAVAAPVAAALAATTPATAADTPAPDGGPILDEERAWAISRVRLSRPMQDFLARIYVDFGLESLRAVEAVFHGARACAVLDRRERVSYDDIAFIVPLALQHRVETSTLARITDHISDKIRSRADRRNREADERSGSDEEAADTADSSAVAGEAETATAGASGALSSNTATGVPAAQARDGAAASTATAADQSSATTNASVQAAPSHQRTDDPQAASAATTGKAFDWGRLFHRFKEWAAGQPDAVAGNPETGQSGTGVAGQGRRPRPKDPHRLPTLPPVAGTVPAKNLVGKPAHPGMGRNIDEPVPGPGTGGGAGGAGNIANPLDYHVEAPPHLARPLVTLNPENLFRTEEELFRR